MNIIDYIPTGSSNAISRKMLCALTGMEDRTMRQSIHEARRTTPILNLSNGDGYFIPDLSDDMDVAMLKHYVAQEESRIKSIGWALKSARKALKESDVNVA